MNVVGVQRTTRKKNSKCLMQSLKVSVLATCFDFNVFVYRLPVECILIPKEWPKRCWLREREAARVGEIANENGEQSLVAPCYAHSLIYEMDMLCAGDRKINVMVKQNWHEIRWNCRYFTVSHFTDAKTPTISFFFIQFCGIRNGKRFVFSWFFLLLLPLVLRMFCFIHF